MRLNPKATAADIIKQGRKLANDPQFNVLLKHDGLKF
jgi:hypothetical protein